VPVRLNGQHLDIDRQDIAVGDDVIAGAGWMSIVSLPSRSPAALLVGGVSVK